MDFVVISICPEALNYARRDTPHPTMIFSVAPTWTAISSPTGSETDPASAQSDQDAEPTMTAPSGPRPDAALHPDASDEYADKPDAEGDS